MNSINYLPFSLGSKLILYADDIVLYRPINSPEDVSILQEDINLILNWTKAHRLVLNSAKTSILPVTRSSQPIPIHLNLGSNPIQTVSCIKYLGVNIHMTCHGKHLHSMEPKLPNPRLAFSIVSYTRQHPKLDTPSTKVQYYPNLSIVAQYGTLILPPFSMNLRKPRSLQGESLPRIGTVTMPPFLITWTGCHSLLTTRCKAQGLLHLKWLFMYSTILIHTLSQTFTTPFT